MYQLDRVGDSPKTLHLEWRGAFLPLVWYVRVSSLLKIKVVERP
jgi:hypothetical protein